MNVCGLMDVATVMLLRKFGPYRITFMIIRFYYFPILPSFLTDNLLIFKCCSLK
jgi:hypothetical protein